MAIQADEVQLALGGLHGLVEGALDEFWRTLDLADPAVARNKLLAFVPELVEQYGVMAASIAADWYDDLRSDMALPSAFDAGVGDVIEREYVEQRARFGAQHLWTDNPEQSLAFLKGAATGYVTQAFADTIIENVLADPEALGWARKPEPDACKFCLMLASRGGSYESKRSALRVVGRNGRARRSRSVGEKYHDNCRCTAVPVWSDTDIAAQHGFDPGELYRQYLAGAFD